MKQGIRKSAYHSHKLRCRRTRHPVVRVYKYAPTNSSSRSVVLNLVYISYPFIKQDYQIYPQYTQWNSFLKSTKLTNSYSLE